MNFKVLLIVITLKLIPYTFEHEGPKSQGINSADKLAALYSNINNPEQIHLALGDQPNDIIIVWSSVEEEKFFVEFGNDPNHLERVLSRCEKMSEHSEQAAKFVYRAQLMNLKPGTRYTYRILSENSKIKSDLFTFEVVGSDPNSSNYFLVMADVGLQTKSLSFIVHEVLNQKYNAVFHIGDIAYNLNIEGGSLGDQFMKRVETFAAKVPYMTTPGDHERFDSFYHYRYRFSMPNSPWPMSLESLWYSIDIGYTHFISINTEAILTNSQEKYKQIEWLKRDLESANKQRQLHPWIIVMGHKPMYCTKSLMEQECHKEHSAIREELEDLFFEQGVDLYISGHKHCYERSWPMYLSRVFQTNTFNPQAPLYIVIGAMGYEYMVDKQMSSPYWLAFAMSNSKKELFARLKVLNETHLIWSVHAGDTNEEVDNVLVIQKKHGSFGKAGPEAFEKIKTRSSNADQLPPEPLRIIDESSQNIQYRRAILFTTVFFLSFITFIFFRNSRVRKVLRL